MTFTITKQLLHKHIFIYYSILVYKIWGLVHDIIFYLIFSNSEVYIKYYMNMGRTVALGLIPFSALIFFNIRIYLRFMLTRGRFQGQGAAGNSQVRYLILYHMKLIVWYFVSNQYNMIFSNSKYIGNSI